MFVSRYKSILLLLTSMKSSRSRSGLSASPTRVKTTSSNIFSRLSSIDRCSHSCRSKIRLHDKAANGQTKLFHLSGEVAYHRGSVRASHPTPPGSIISVPQIILDVCLDLSTHTMEIIAMTMKPTSTRRNKLELQKKFFNLDFSTLTPNGM